MSENIMNIIMDALDVYIQCTCKSQLLGREGESRVQSGDAILARAISKEIRDGRFLIRLDCMEVDCE